MNRTVFVIVSASLVSSVPRLVIAAGESDDIKNFGWTVGLAAERYKSPYIRKASINGDQKLVTVDEQAKWVPSAWSTVNWTATDCTKLEWICSEWIKPGLFAGVRLVAPDGDSLFDAFSVGVQWALLRKLDDDKKTTRGSLNFGVGFVWHGTRTLQNGILEGEPLPSQFQDVRFRESTETSWMLVVSKNILN